MRFHILHDVHRMWYHDKSIQDLRSLLSDGRVLDLGCGKGHVCASIPNNYDNYALDISKNALHLVREKNNKVETICGSALYLPLRNEVFDAVISTQVIEHVSEKKMLSEVLRILRNNGFLILATIVRGPLNIGLSRNKFGKRVLSPNHLHEYSSIETLTDAVGKVTSGKLSLRWKEKKPIRFPLRITLKPIFSLMGIEDKLKTHALLVPIPLYYYDVYMVFEKRA